jgi:hypothetical protein
VPVLVRRAARGGGQFPADPRLREGFVGLPDQSLDGRPGPAGRARDASRRPVCPLSVIDRPDNLFR